MPLFFDMGDFSQAYATENVIGSSLFLPPSAIGSLSSDERHHVAFDSATLVVYSQPKNISEKGIWGKAIFRRLAKHLKKPRKKRSLGRFERLSEKMWSLAAQHGRPERLLNPQRELRVRGLHPVEQVRFLASSIFGCETIFVRRKDVSG
jgi:hypothetical protein